MLQSPTSDAFPPVKPWDPADATLLWTYKPNDDMFLVNAFNKQLKCAYLTDKESEVPPPVPETKDKEKDKDTAKAATNALSETAADEESATESIPAPKVPDPPPGRTFAGGLLSFFRGRGNFRSDKNNNNNIYHKI